MELSDSEKIAYRMIMAVPEAVSSIQLPNGAIDIKDLHRYMHSLVRSLDFAEMKRRNDYIDSVTTSS